MTISFRITAEALQKDEMCEGILNILENHGWEKCVLVTHSYGSIISTHLLQNPTTAARIGPIMLIDPVSFLLHLPDVAYNFTVRKPRRANEHQLWYFASMDMGVAHTLYRRFFWSENIIWKHDIKDRRVTVSLSGVDLIVDTEVVGRYLIDGDDPDSKPHENGNIFNGANGEANSYSLADEEWKHRKWQGEGLDVLWFPDLDHAQVFDSKKDRRLLVDAVRTYCLKDS